MEKKIIYSAVALSAVAFISYQTWKSINTKEILEETVADTVIETKDTNPVPVSTTPPVLEKKSYSSTVPYTVGDDDNSVKVDVVLEGFTLVSLDISYVSDSPNSKMRQDKFEKNFDKSSLIGTDITDATITNVTGATLTTDAFKDAIKSIVGQL